jgi:hypothetical protein
MRFWCGVKKRTGRNLRHEARRKIYRRLRCSRLQFGRARREHFGCEALPNNSQRPLLPIFFSNDIFHKQIIPYPYIPMPAMNDVEGRTRTTKEATTNTCNSWFSYNIAVVDIHATV